MTQEEKQLVIKDLSARLPYGVMVLVKGEKYFNETNEPYIVTLSFGTYLFDDEDITLVPYLRPLSSMTEEEEKEFNHVFELELAALEEPAIGHTIKSAASNAFVIDFYNRHHFDFRGLIPMGLALEAKEGMYKF